MRMYNKFGNPYWSDRPCPDCDTQLDDHNTNYNAGTGPVGPDGIKTKVFLKYCDKHYHKRARERMVKFHIEGRERHLVTGVAKMDWKREKAVELGGDRNRLGTPEWQSYLDKAEELWAEERKANLLNTTPAQEVIDFIRKPPKFNQGKYKSPLARAVAKSKIKTDPDVSREGPGVVYVYEDEMKIPGVLKIGSTKYSKGRLPSANTWGAFNCLYERHFEKRFEAEDIVHTMLGDYRIWSDKEWFRVSLEQAIKAIEGVELDDTKEQALG